MVDLENVAGEDQLGAVARAGDDGLHLVRGQVLRLVDDEVDVDQAAATNVGERRDDQLLFLAHLADTLVARVGHPPLVLDDAQIVVERLHVRVELGLDVAGQKADVFVRERHHRPRHEDLAVLLLVLQRRGEGEQGLARARLARDADQLDLGIRERVEREGLFGVARGDAVGGNLVHAAEHRPIAVVGGKGRLLAVTKDEVFIGHQRPLEGEVAGADGEGLRVHAVDQRLVDVFPKPDPSVERGDVLDVVVAIILRHEAQGLGLQAQIDVLADQDDLPSRECTQQLVGDVQDLVVGRALLEGQAQIVVVLAADLDDDVAEVLADPHALAEERLLRQRVDGAQELARVKVGRLVPLLEAIQLLEHRHGNDNVVLRELIDALAVVKDDVGVEHEHLQLPSNCHRVGAPFAFTYDDEDIPPVAQVPARNYSVPIPDGIAYDPDDGVAPGEAGVERRHQGQPLATRGEKLFLTADSDLLERLQAIGDEGRTEDRQALLALSCKLGDGRVGVGVDPWVAPEAGLEADAPSAVGQLEPRRQGARGGETLCPVAVAVGLAHPLAAVRRRQTVTAGLVGLAQVAFRQAVEAHEHVIGLFGFENGAPHGRERVDEGGSIVECPDEGKRRRDPRPAGHAADFDHRRAGGRRRVLRIERKDDHAPRAGLAQLFERGRDRRPPVAHAELDRPAGTQARAHGRREILAVPEQGRPTPGPDLLVGGGAFPWAQR